MRILHAAHAFVPQSQAGVELYTDAVSAAQAVENVVAVLHAVTDWRAPDRTLRRSRRGRVELFELVQHGRWRSFEESYASRVVADRLEAVLDAFAPDVVHVQHLERLSIGLIERCRTRGIPVVMSVHDYWLTCANGGQRYHRRLGRCPLLDARRCARCTAHMNAAGFAARAAWRHLLDRVGRPGQPEDGGGAPRPAAAASGVVARSGLAAASGLAALARAGFTALAPAQRRAIEHRWAAMRELAEGIDCFLVPSRSLLGDLVRFGLPERRLRHLPYGIAIAPGSPRELPERARRFFFAGSLVPHKGPHVLLEAFRGVPGCELVIAGSPSAHPAYFARIEAAIRAPGVSLAGPVPHERIGELFAASDCLVVPSLWLENAPFVIQEAFACGLPVVASRLGGHVELLARGGGLLYDADDPIALRSALRELAERPGRLRELAATIPPVTPLADHVRELQRCYARAAARARPATASLPAPV